MNVIFRIHYQTVWGQQLVITGPTPEIGAGQLDRAFQLDYLGGGFWGGAIDFPKSLQTLEYKYVLIDNNSGTEKSEWGELRRVDLKDIKGSSLVLRDAWRVAQHPENALYTSAFRDVILPGGTFTNPPPAFEDLQTIVRFRLSAPRVDAGCRLCVTGNIRELGEWDPSRALLLENTDYPAWEGQVALTSGLAVEYKYGFYDPEAGKIISLESGPNRSLAVDLLEGTGKTIILCDEYYQNPRGYWKGAGVAVPVFSLRSQKDLGVGEFLDLKLMVDWALQTGLKMVQILPVNDTSATNSWVDSYPYAAISVFALHPLYLNIDALGTLPEKESKKLKATRAKLNALPEIDYQEVTKAKLQFARLLFREQKAAFLKDEGFKTFLKNNDHWLKPYAAFCYLRDKYDTSDFNQWEEWATFSSGKLKKLTAVRAPHFDDIAFHYYLQYHLDKQLREAADYARDKGVILKGDIPIGIYRYSVDAWVAPHLYNMDGQAGAPPDPFSETGQNWGFPTYNWEEMAKDGYRWWQQRLQQLSRYFDAFRIDHILGFFRIWEIPITQVQGLLGHFNPAIPVLAEEFRQQGIAFDSQRFCQPFITEGLIREWFGEEADYVRKTFLEPLGPPDLYRLKAAFSNQRAIETFLQRPRNKKKASLKDRLFDLVGNLLFFDFGADEYHPRIMMENTPSFQALDPFTRQQLQELYIDYFFRRQEDFWRHQAMTKLPAIKDATNMLICGEDLGMVPDCVPGVMDELGILSLEIQRMSKNPQTEFLQPEDIPYLSVCSPSTHDMSPLRLWWEEMEPEQRQRFYHQELGFSGDPPFFCEPWVIERILFQHLYWPSMWAVFPLQDLIAMDGRLRRENPKEERINIPSNPKHYWRYRFHLSMEDLLQANTFNRRLQAMLLATGRQG